MISCIDLTSLNETDNEVVIENLCEKAITTEGCVAAVCVYPQFVAIAKHALLGMPVNVAAVANFPHGRDPLLKVLKSIEQSIRDGAKEIDVVFPYEAYLAGESEFAKDFVKQCKQACGEKVLLKVILETGVLSDERIIRQASQDILVADADFLKTSTGKVAVGATLFAAKEMLTVIKEMSTNLNRPLGFKASGGVRTIEQASEYINLANNIMGQDWVTPHTFRIGASKLLV